MRQFQCVVTQSIAYWIFREEDKISTWIEIVEKIETIKRTIIGTAIPLTIAVITIIIAATVISSLSAA